MLNVAIIQIHFPLKKILKVYVSRICDYNDLTLIICPNYGLRQDQELIPQIPLFFFCISKECLGNISYSSLAILRMVLEIFRQEEL